MRKGFTLVELSIVLVIIGLLIGGILVGQSLISSSKIAAFVTQIQQFDAGVNSFKTKYKYLPGDAKGFDIIGNGNGFIEDGLINCCGYTYTSTRTGENENFWTHMQMSGFKIKGIPSTMALSSTWASAAPASVAAGSQNIPKMPLGVNTGANAFTVTVDVAAGNSAFGNGSILLGENNPRSNYYFIADFSRMTDGNISTGGNATRYWSDSIPTEQAQALDSKMDDGITNTGKIFNASYWDSTCSIATGKYNISNGNALCALLIKMPN